MHRPVDQFTRAEDRPREDGDWIAEPPSWPLYVLCALAAIALLWSATQPYFDPFFTVSFYVIVLLAGYWFLRLVIHWWVRGWGRWRFVAAPVGGLVVAALLHANVPFHARWAVGEGALTAKAQSIGPAGEGAWTRIKVPGRIGTYRIRAAHQVDGGVIFAGTFSCDLGDPAGFGWFPGAPPDPTHLERVDEFQHPSFHHLDGPWYTWCASDL